MRVDVDALGTFNALAHEGAQAATQSLTTMTGLSATVSVTAISLLDREALEEYLAGEDPVGVRFEFDGAMAGETTMVFERAAADRLVTALGVDADDEAMARSSLTELGNVMMSGFIDGWAEYLGETIEHSPPTYVEEAVVPASQGEEHAFVFESAIEWVGEPVTVSIFMVPERTALTEALADADGGSGDAVPIDKLEVFNEMTERGTQTAAGNVGAMTGLDVTADVTRTRFVPIEDVPAHVGTDDYVGTVVEFEGTPSGYLVVLFDEPSAATIATALAPGGEVPEGTPTADVAFGPEHEPAIEELGNVVASGLLDGWANVLQTSIEHTPPRLVQDMGRAILDPIAARMAERQDHAFVIDSTLSTATMDIDTAIHAIPDETELRRALEELDVDRADQTEADVGEVFDT